MTNTMIERVAKALEKNLEGKEFSSFEDAARAAIEAMREPTPKMIEAAQSTADPYCESWPVMIDAALSEDPSAT